MCSATVKLKHIKRRYTCSWRYAELRGHQMQITVTFTKYCISTLGIAG